MKYNARWDLVNRGKAKMPDYISQKHTFADVLRLGNKEKCIGNVNLCLASFPHIQTKDYENSFQLLLTSLIHEVNGLATLSRLQRSFHSPSLRCGIRNLTKRDIKNLITWQDLGIYPFCSICRRKEIYHSNSLQVYSNSIYINWRWRGQCFLTV